MPPVGFKKVGRNIPTTGGVYIIQQGRKVVYVGRTKNLRDRLNCHLVRRLPGFHAFILETKNSMELEAELINHYKPMLNRHRPQENLITNGGMKKLRQLARNPNNSLTKMALHFHTTDQTINDWIKKYAIPRGR